MFIVVHAKQAIGMCVVVSVSLLFCNRETMRVAICTMNNKTIF